MYVCMSVSLSHTGRYSNYAPDPGLSSLYCISLSPQTHAGSSMYISQFSFLACTITVDRLG